jgi:hypothetical protein
MVHVSEQNRSGLCHLITDFHSASQRRLARLDFVGAAASGLLVLILLDVARLLLST